MRAKGRGRLIGIALTLALAGTSLSPRQAHAQTQVTATGKGITGLALVGGELFVSVSALVGVRNSWLLLGLTAVGAIGGGIAGYFLERSGPSAPEFSVAALAAGVVLLIPATVIVAGATAYRPGNEEIPSPPAPSGGAAEPAPAAGAEPSTPAAPPASRTEAPSGSLLHLHRGTLALGAPAPLLVAAFTPDEVRRYGVSPQYGLTFPVFRMSW